MADVAADNLLANASAKLKLMLANSSTWQAWVGAEDAAGAAAYIHEGVFHEEDIARAADRSPTAPFCMLDIETPRSEDKHLVTGTALCYIEASIAAAYVGDAEADNAIRAFRNQIGGIIEDLWDLSEDGSQGYHRFVGIVPEDERRGTRMREAVEGHVMSCVISADWEI